MLSAATVSSGRTRIASAQPLAGPHLRARPHHAAGRPARRPRRAGPMTACRPAGHRGRRVRPGPAGRGVQVGPQVVAGRAGVEVDAADRRRPPARRPPPPAATPCAPGRDGAAGRSRDAAPGQQREPGEAAAAELRCRRAATGRASIRTVSPVPAVQHRGESGCRARRPVGQVGVGVADQHAPAVDPVLEVADARRRCRAGRPARPDRWARSPTCATTWSREVAGVDGDVGRAGEAAARPAGPGPGPAAPRCRPGTAPWAACSVSGRSRRPSPAASTTAQTAVMSSGTSGRSPVRPDAVVARAAARRAVSGGRSSSRVPGGLEHLGAVDHRDGGGRRHLGLEHHVDPAPGVHDGVRHGRARVGRVAARCRTPRAAPGPRPPPAARRG